MNKVSRIGMMVVCILFMACSFGFYLYQTYLTTPISLSSQDIEVKLNKAELIHIAKQQKQQIEEKKQSHADSLIRAQALVKQTEELLGQALVPNTPPENTASFDEQAEALQTRLDLIQLDEDTHN